MLFTTPAKNLTKEEIADHSKFEANRLFAFQNTSTMEFSSFDACYAVEQEVEKSVLPVGTMTLRAWRFCDAARIRIVQIKGGSRIKSPNCSNLRPRPQSQRVRRIFPLEDCIHIHRQKTKKRTTLSDGKDPVVKASQDALPIVLIEINSLAVLSARGLCFILWAFLRVSRCRCWHKVDTPSCTAHVGKADIRLAPITDFIGSLKLDGPWRVARESARSQPSNPKSGYASVFDRLQKPAARCHFGDNSFTKARARAGPAFSHRDRGACDVEPAVENARGRNFRKAAASTGLGAATTSLSLP